MWRLIMNKLLKSFLLSSMLCGIPIPVNAYQNSGDNSALQNILFTGAAVVTTVAVNICFYKLFNWAYYYNIDRTPVETFIMRFAYEQELMEPYLQDYELYHSTKLTLPLIVNQRCPDSQYPTLSYYDSLQEISNKLSSIESAFKRKKSKEENIITIAMIDGYIIQVSCLREKINNFRRIVYSSNAYTIEYKAKNPPQPIIIYKEYKKEEPAERVNNYFFVNR